MPTFHKDVLKIELDRWTAASLFSFSPSLELVGRCSRTNHCYASYKKRWWWGGRTVVQTACKIAGEFSVHPSISTGQDGSQQPLGLNFGNILLLQSLGQQVNKAWLWKATKPQGGRSWSEAFSDAQLRSASTAEPAGLSSTWQVNGTNSADRF